MTPREFQYSGSLDATPAWGKNVAWRNSLEALGCLRGASVSRTPIPRVSPRRKGQFPVDPAAWFAQHQRAA
ncbi:MAG: hypothetical protein K0S45_3612 [Nitrospira sp.]|nr:hypothetical protein [Nitrospira sp.]